MVIGLRAAVVTNSTALLLDFSILPGSYDVKYCAAGSLQFWHGPDDGLSPVPNSITELSARVLLK